MNASEVLARCCAPEPIERVPSVRISDLWKWTWEALEKSTAREELIEHWASSKYLHPRSNRERYGIQSAADRILTRSLVEGVFCLRLHDGSRAWRFPTEAFSNLADECELEMMWSRGKLWELDLSGEFRAVADLDLPLLTTDDEALAFQTKLLAHFAGFETDRASEPTPEDVSRRAAWLADFKVRPRWTFAEALLWAAYRNWDEVADAICDPPYGEVLNTQGAGWASALVELRGGRGELAEARPTQALLKALQDDRISATGLFEGEGQRRPIGPEQWDDLEFCDGPPEVKGAAACRIGQLHGARWRGHWVGLRFDRESMVSSFKPAESKGLSDEEALDLISAALREKGGYIPQDEGADLVRAVDPTFRRTRARALVKRLTGNVKPGPQGPRKKAP